MSGGYTCKEPSHRPYWVVTQRRSHRSAFSGYHTTPSDYSTVRCRVKGCPGLWRSKAAYVASLPDGSYSDPEISPGAIVATTSGAPPA